MTTDLDPGRADTKFANPAGNETNGSDDQTSRRSPRRGQRLAVLGGWPLRRWVAAGAAAIATVLTVAVPTALIPNPVFDRMIPAPWWNWPALLLSSALTGLLIATYVRTGPAETGERPDGRSSQRGGTAGFLLTFFAVGCPICNKIVILALGTAGALTWFEPVQPLLQVGAVAVLAWALVRRLDGEIACALPR